MAREECSRSIGTMWADQMEMWNCYTNLVRDQSEKMVNLWMGQTFDIQKEGQKFFADWLRSVGQTSSDFCRVWEGQVKQATSGAAQVYGESRPSGQA